MQRAMGRAPCCSGDHEGLKKGPWTREEDEKLKSFLLLNPNTSWRLVPPKAGLLRCGKSCRLRWMNYLRPDIKRGNFTPEEENLIIQLHSAVGNRWSAIASQLPGRTDNEIKNLWNTKLKKLLVLKGINPITHQPLCNPLLSDYVKQWVKSIEDVIIAGIMTQSSPNINNFSTIDAPVDAYLPSLRSLPPQPPFSIEYHTTQPHIPKPNPTSHDYIYPTNMDSGFWVDENFQNSGRSLIDDLILDEGSSLPGSLSDQFLGDVWEEKTNSPVMEMASSGANLTLEEAFKYWN